MVVRRRRSHNGNGWDAHALSCRLQLSGGGRVQSTVYLPKLHTFTEVGTLQIGDSGKVDNGIATPHRAARMEGCLP